MNVRYVQDTVLPLIMENGLGVSGNFRDCS